MQRYLCTWYLVQPGDSRSAAALRRVKSGKTDAYQLSIAMVIALGTTFVTFLGMVDAVPFLLAALSLPAGIAVVSVLFVTAPIERFKRGVRHGQILAIHSSLRQQWLAALKAADVSEHFAVGQLTSQHFRTLTAINDHYRAHLVNDAYTQEAVQPQLAAIASEIRQQLDLAQAIPSEQLKALNAPYGTVRK